MNLLFLSFLLACISCSDETESLDRERFEDDWWELQSYPACFNINNETNQLLIYEGFIYEAGEWKFEDPSLYHVYNSEDTYSIHVSELDNCWTVKVKGGIMPIADEACKCELIPWIK